jgi:hypothetical protein
VLVEVNCQDPKIYGEIIATADDARVRAFGIQNAPVEFLSGETTSAYCSWPVKISGQTRLIIECLARGFGYVPHKDGERPP